MKEGWEYKKLGEVCDIYQPKTISAKDLVEEGKYFVYGANGIIGKYNSYNHKGSEVLMTCRGATCGTINVSKPYSWINGNAMVIHPLSSNLSSSFLVYLLKGMDLSDVITGAAQPQITRQSLAPKKIAVPPVSEQQHIVEELDLLSSIIEKKKAQLNELDNMSQSLFYEMFGDPMTNERGWSLSTWSDVLTIINGKNQKVVEDSSGKYPIYGSGGIMGYASDFLCPENTVIIGRKGNINKPILVKTPFWNVDTAFGLVCNLMIINHYYLYFFCKIFDFNILNKAVTIPSLTKKDLLDIKMPVPPFTLQQQFSSKIEVIDYQKELLKKSIKEVKILLNSRMDYWFDK